METPRADSLLEIVPLHITTATETTNPFVVLPGPQGGLVNYNPYRARIQYFDAMQASGSGVWTFSVLISYTNGATWVSNVSGPAITLTAAAQDAQQTIQVNPNQQTDTGRIFLTVIATLSGSPVSPTIVYRADLLLP